MDIQLTEQIIIMLAVLVLLTSFAMLVQRKIFGLINLFMWQGIFLALTTAFVGYISHRYHLYISAVLTLVLKVISLPYILHVLINKLKINRDVEPVVNVISTMLIGIALVIFSYHLTAPIRDNSDSVAQSIIAIALATVLIGLLMMITRRKAVTQIIGFLVMENGLFFAAISATYGMPLVVELGVAIDILIAAFVFGIFTFHINTTFDSLDVDKMSQLKEDY